MVVGADAVEQAADDRLFVAGADQDAVAALFFRLREGLFLKDTDDRKDDIMEEEQKKEPPYRPEHDPYDPYVFHDHLSPIQCYTIVYHISVT